MIESKNNFLSVLKRALAVFLIILVLPVVVPSYALDSQTEANHYMTTLINAAEYAHFDKITVNKDFTEFVVIVNDANARTLEEADIAATLYEIAQSYSSKNVSKITVDYMNWVGDILAIEDFDGKSVHSGDVATRSSKPSSITSTKKSTTSPKPSPTPVPPTKTERMVWIPTNGGKKYHSNSGCSGMKNPVQVTISEAISRGFDACKKCRP